MARRYRYSFAKKKESGKGKWSAAIAVLSVVLFLTAIYASFWLEKKYEFIAGGVCLFTAMLTVYGFILGLRSFSEKNCTHVTSIIGSITNGVFMVAWLGFYLIGLR
ncbi:MAG: hypothetical protein KBT01_09785 [Clostridiales bacterium]|nr:hypothetical protein [Candidatus Blautia equi]